MGEIRVKNYADAIIFRTAICFGAKANSFDGRCKFEICIASFATSCSEMRISAISCSEMENSMDKIMELYKKYKDIIMYIIFGALTTLVNFCSFFILTKLHLKQITDYSGARRCGAVFEELVGLIHKIKDDSIG